MWWQSIASDLKAHYGPFGGSDPDAWSLARGGSGVALLFAYLSEALGDDDARMTAARLIEAALEAAAGGMKAAGLYAGFTGVGWALAHLDGWLLDLSDGDPNDAVDTALLEVLSSLPRPDEYDLISPAWWALACTPGTAATTERRRASGGGG